MERESASMWELSFVVSPNHGKVCLGAEKTDRIGALGRIRASFNLPITIAEEVHFKFLLRLNKTLLC